MPRRMFVGIIAFVLLLTAVSAAPVSGGDGLGYSAVAAVTPADDGGWWVLERSLQSQEGVVHHYSDSWKRTGERHRIRTAGKYGGSPTDVAPANGGGWWAFGAGGSVYRFSENWTYTGDSRVLSHPYYDGNLSGGAGLTRTTDGGWWVAGDRDLFRYTGNWTFANSSVKVVTGVSSGYPVAVGYGFEGSLWVLEGYTGTGVSRYPLTEDGSRIAPGSTRTVDADAGRLLLGQHSGGFGIHSVVDTPVDIARAGDGWWVVDADGQVHRFDRYWRYTGVTHPVGSDDAEGTYPADFVSPLILFVPLVTGVIWLLPAMTIGAGVLWHGGANGRNSLFAGATGAAAFVYGVAWRPFLVRPVVFVEPHLPLVVSFATLILAVAHLYAFTTTDERIAPVALTYLPALLAAAWMLPEAARPWM